MSIGWRILHGALLLAGCIFAWERYTDALIEQGDAAGYKRAQAEYTARELQAVKEAREEEHRKTQAAEKEADEARKNLAALRGSYDDAVSAGQRLRAQLAAALAKRSGPADPAPSSGSAPAVSSADLLSDVLRRLEEAENGTIKFADESHLAGTTCSRIYEQMRSK
jgi:predicted  nucleic acid-binding Zn-ribbon protein